MVIIKGIIKIIMENKYNPTIAENKIQSFWKENDFFKSTNKGNKSFSIIMPPPNVTGRLHLGHAWNSYYPDMLIRYKQMSGFEAIWYPGMDHAGIATQAKVEKKLFEDEGKNRFDYGRETFLSKIWDWKNEFASNIESQWDKIGIAIDYDKTKFTLDDDVNKIVLDAFVKLYNKGLIFKGERLINWDPVLKTAISNIEINHEEKTSKLYNIRYQVEGTDDYLVIATTRPETMFGDSAVFVHPEDERHKELVGKYLINPSNGKRLQVHTDSYVEMSFGTGALKVTPAHDFNDYELGKKYSLEFINIMNEDATLNEQCGEFNGMDRFEARKALINKLEAEGKIDSIEEHKNSVGTSDRSGAIVEPRLSEQWFLKSSHLAKMSKEAQQDPNKKVDFYPSRFENVYETWLDGMEDWCVSRQLWWGHRIPAWYKEGEIKVQIESPGEGWTQDEDVLDTWFSSALWPIVFADENVISRSENNSYLSDTLFTGYDIILFWVSRMIYQSLELDGRPPFKKAVIHGLMRDEKGRKMSKSLGNGIDPMDVIEKWGSDSLRSFVLGNSTPGQDIKFNETKINSAWDLNNKLFNSGKLLNMLSNDNKFEYKSINYINQTKIDTYIINRLNEFKSLLDNNIEEYNLSIIFNEMNRLVFDDFANNYLEFVKQDREDQNQIHNAVIIFIELLKLLHALIPFTTEEIYQGMKDSINLKESIMLERYVEINVNVDKDIDSLLAAIKAARIIDSKPEFISGSKSEIYIDTDNEVNIEFINKYISYLNATLVTDIKEEYSDIEVFPGVGIVYSTFNNADNKTIQTLKNEIKDKIEFELKRANGMLSNEKFVSNADPSLVKAEQDKVKFYNSSLELIK